MRKLSILLASVALGGCASMQTAFDTNVYLPHYDMELTQVERPASAKQRYGPSTIATLHDTTVSRYAFEDQLVKLIAYAAWQEIYLNIQNKTDHSVKLVWNDAAFVGVDGKSEPVMHVGMKYTDCSAPKAPSVIVQHGQLEDSATPCGHVFFVSSWNVVPLIALQSAKAADTVAALATAKQQIGKTVQLLLPLQIEETVNDYLLTFTVRDVHLQPHNAYAAYSVR